MYFNTWVHASNNFSSLETLYKESEPPQKKKSSLLIVNMGSLMLRLSVLKHFFTIFTALS